MSRAYQVRLATTRADDEARRHIQMLDILPAGEMLGLLGRELVRAGWILQDDGSHSREIDGLKVAVDPLGAAVVIAAKAEGKISEEAAARGDAEKQIQDVGEMVDRDLADALGRVYVDALKIKAGRMGKIVSVEESATARGKPEVSIRVEVQ